MPPLLACCRHPHFPLSHRLSHLHTCCRKCSAAESDIDYEEVTEDEDYSADDADDDDDENYSPIPALAGTSNRAGSGEPIKCFGVLPAVISDRAAPSDDSSLPLLAYRRLPQSRADIPNALPCIVPLSHPSGAPFVQIQPEHAISDWLEDVVAASDASMHAFAADLRKCIRVRVLAAQQSASLAGHAAGSEDALRAMLRAPDQAVHEFLCGKAELDHTTIEVRRVQSRVEV